MPQVPFLTSSSLLELSLSEALIKFIITHKAHHSQDRPTLVSIGGPGGTGKSTLSKALCGLCNWTIIHLDDYKMPRSERVQKNIYGAHPEANHIELIVKHLQQLSSGRSIDKPIYNAVSGEVDSSEKIHPKDVILVDGEISSYDELREYFDLSIFIDAHWKTQLQTRINRDVDIRRYTPEKAIATFLHSNLYEFKKFGEHTQDHCDLVIFCDESYSLSFKTHHVRLIELITSFKKMEALP
jgi:uridine kinase